MTNNSKFDEQSGCSSDRLDSSTYYSAETLGSISLLQYPNLLCPLSGKSIYAKFNNQVLINFFIASEEWSDPDMDDKSLKLHRKIQKNHFPTQRTHFFLTDYLFQQ